jgi:hypothetical protein
MRHTRSRRHAAHVLTGEAVERGALLTRIAPIGGVLYTQATPYAGQRRSFTFIWEGNAFGIGDVDDQIR